MIRRSLLCISAGLIAFTYAVAPLGILIRAAVRRRPVASAAVEPSVTVVIAARNEAGVIAQRLANLAAQDYPADRLQVVIASDGSEDDTVRIARAAAGPRVTVLDLPRVGKADALNAAVAQASGDVIVFSDANTRFASDAVRAIVRPLADPTVGGVAGNQVYERGGAADQSHGERGYWDFDRLIKRAESAAGSTVSATGALYAVRRELVPTIISGVTDDFYTSTAVVDRGRRLVFAEDAVAYEPPAPTSSGEYRRKVRVITRGFRGVAARSALLDPRRTGFYAIQLGWHKVLRRLMAIPIAVVGIMTLALAREGLHYRLLAGLQLAGYATAIVATLAPRSRFARFRPVALGTFVVMVNVASVHALVDVLRGKRIERWEPGRLAGPASDPEDAEQPGSDGGR
jgi:glycosyltransferase involved in cell wall biosynthesis